MNDVTVDPAHALPMTRTRARYELAEQAERAAATWGTIGSLVLVRTSNPPFFLFLSFSMYVEGDKKKLLVL